MYIPMKLHGAFELDLQRAVSQGVAGSWLCRSVSVRLSTLYIYVYIYVNIYVYIYIYTYIYMYIHVHINTWGRHAYIYISIECIGASTYPHICIHEYLHVCVC